MSFKKGDAVVQVLPEAVKGTVEGFSLDQDTGEVKILVKSVDAEGVEHFGYFSQNAFVAA